MNTFGTTLKIMLFGASHERYIGLTIDGYPAGIKLDETRIKAELTRRRGPEEISSKRREEDNYEIISGYFKERTTGAPLTFLIANTQADSMPYEINYGRARPSHADYTYYKKYHGFSDYRGGGSASGRLSVALVVLGAICDQLLNKKGILIGSRIKSLWLIQDDEIDINAEILKALLKDSFPVYNKDKKERMILEIKKAINSKDSIGGVTESYITGLPMGLGDPFFNGAEALVAHLLFSIPGVKGVEFGAGFGIAKMMGSVANDEMYYEDDKVCYRTNNSGGVSGGITNGAPMIIRTAFKPTPSISKKQNTINFIKETNEEIEITGHHDPVIAVKGLYVINALLRYGVLEMMLKERML